MKKEYIVLIIVLSFVQSSFGQKMSYIRSNKNNPFDEMSMHISDSISRKLYLFLNKRGEAGAEDTSQMAIKLGNLLGGDKANHFKFREGIYWFKLREVHAVFFYFIYTSKNGIQIISTYKVNELLPVLMQYFNTNHFDEDKKLEYLNIIIHDLKQRNHWQIDGTIKSFN